MNAAPALAGGRRPWGAGPRAELMARRERAFTLLEVLIAVALVLALTALVLPGLHDTQCGFKLWTAEAAQEGFAGARIDGFSFDVEVLYVARRRGRRIAEVPVTWTNDAASRVTLWRGSTAFLDLARIPWNGLLGRYG